jgi:hypothetical protein
MEAERPVMLMVAGGRTFGVEEAEDVDVERGEVREGCQIGVVGMVPGAGTWMDCSLWRAGGVSPK